MVNSERTENLTFGYSVMKMWIHLTKSPSCFSKRPGPQEAVNGGHVVIYAIANVGTFSVCMAVAIVF
jgi:hypothetical protein